ncbi:MAG: PHP domain-containing protein [Candidatus Anstonellales archaeon]
MIKVDLHTHSNNSPDGTCSIKELAISAGKRGLDAIGVSDHNYLSSGRKKIGSVLIIYGQEVSTLQGHVLVYGVKKQFQAGIDARRLVREVRGLGGITIAAHPYALRQDSVGDLADEFGFDAIERFNGRNFVNNIRNIIKNRHGVGGSDAHCAAEVGNAYTVLNCDLDEESIIKSIKTQDYRAVWSTKPSSIPLRYAMRLRRFVKLE